VSLACDKLVSYSMNPVLSKSFLVAALVGLATWSAAQPPARKPAPQKKVAATKPKESALDKATLEPYVRHLFVWGPKIQVTLSDPAPSSQLPGFLEVKVQASAAGASQEETFLVSSDGQKILKAAVFDIAQNPFKPDLDRLKTQFQPSFGTPGATVVLVVFSDFECPYCKDEAKMLRQNLLSAYPKQVRVYFKDFPLEPIHPWAKPAAIAGRCVFRLNPGAFWDYYDWMFEHQQEITLENLKAKVLEFARGKPVDALQLSRCIDTRATESEVDRNAAEARALQVNSLPALFVNGRRLVGQVAWPNLRQIIDYEIDYQKTAHNAGEEACCELPPLGPVAK